MGSFCSRGVLSWGCDTEPGGCSFSLVPRWKMRENTAPSPTTMRDRFCRRERGVSVAHGTFCLPIFHPQDSRGLRGSQKHKES